MKLKAVGRAVTVVLGFTLCTTVAQAQWAPPEDLVLVTHSSPGTGNDLMLRELMNIWLQNDMIPVEAGVENVRGGGGLKARAFVAVNSKGDEHVLWSYTPTQLVRPLLRGDDINHTSFTPIAMLAVDPMVLVVHADSSYRTLKDLVEAIKAEPGKILQGGGPFGNSASIAGEQFKGRYDLDSPYTPFQGGGDAVLQLLGQHVDFIIENPAEVKEHVAKGSLRILATTDSIALYPDVPTFKAAGYPFDDLKAFRGIMAPPGISNEARQYYVDLLQRTIESQEWKEYVENNALTNFWLVGEEMQEYLNEQAEYRMQVLQELGISKQ